MISRFFSVLILTLAVFTGVVLFAYGMQYPQTSAKEQQEEMQTPIERISSIPSRVLSSFSLFPLQKKERSFFAVMIENHQLARPYHVGLEDAVMVEEYMVEGFISRFVALFDVDRIPKEVGPVRSLRPYFLDAIAPWTRIVFHAGGSPEALSRVQSGNTFFARNLLYYDDENHSLRKKGPLAPHNLFLKAPLIRSFLEEVPDSLSLSVQWPLFPTGMPEGGENAKSVSVNFFNPQHNVSFDFQPLSQKYRRTNGLEISPARPSTVVVLEVPIDAIGEYGRLSMHTEGSGKAYVFHSGRMWNARWSRSDFTKPFRFTNEEGEDIPFAQGQVWMMTLPTLERVSWE